MAGRMKGRGRGNERGAAAVTALLFFLLIGGFVALVVNVGHMIAVRGRLQNAVDAAALAGAWEFNGKDEGLDRAPLKAEEFAERHATDKGIDVDIEPDRDVTLGVWDPSLPRKSAFTAMEASAPNAATLINAVEVKAGREGGNALRVYFGAFLGGRKTTEVRASAVALRGAPCDSNCPLPVALSESFVRGLECDEERVLVFSNDNEDNVGFTSLEAEASSNSNRIGEILEGIDCPRVSKGDLINMSNGSNVSSNNILDAFKAKAGTTGVVPVVGTDKYNQLREVLGFATLEVVEVVGSKEGKNNKPGVAQKNSLRVIMRCEQVDDSARSAGCANYGTWTQPLLVR